MHILGLSYVHYTTKHINIGTRENRGNNGLLLEYIWKAVVIILINIFFQWR